MSTGRLRISKRKRGVFRMRDPLVVLLGTIVLVMAITLGTVELAYLLLCAIM